MSQESINNEMEVEIVDDYSPLDMPVKERSYTNHHIQDAESLGDLEEPSFAPPSFEDEFEDAEEEQRQAEPLNQAYSELSGKDKTTGAKVMVDVVIDIYSKGCSLLAKIPQISEEKIDRLIAEGEIDPNIQIPAESGSMNIKDFAVEYNSSISEAFEVSDEFKETVAPIMERVFKKRGIGMTDEQSLAYYFGTDILTKGIQVVTLRKTTNSLIDSLKESTLATKEYTARMREQQSSSNTNASRPEPVVKTKVTEAKEEEEVVYEKPKRKTTPKTNLDEQVEYFEPEEVGNEVYSVLNSGSGFKHETKVDANMPNFGDPEILAGIDKIEKESAIKKPVRKKAVKNTNFKKREPRRTVAPKPKRGGTKSQETQE